MPRVSTLPITFYLLTSSRCCCVRGIKRRIVPHGGWGRQSPGRSALLT